ncbi:MAG: hypothetical protein CM1200mP38_7480 [Dehalococcoidia bacterium]|nr:MAG: hypothetical protein CM1200mP38_7480 [Dehalococcoidia bacterium]
MNADKVMKTVHMDNQNYYLILQSFPSPHPYNWPTIGSQEDLDNAKIDDVKEFFL